MMSINEKIGCVNHDCDKCKAQPAAPKGWQPIDTAPKTSKAILVHCADRKNTFTVTWARDEEFPWSGKWKHFAGDVLTETPTHWMPIPAAPEKV